MLTEGPTQPDAQYFMNRFVSWEIASKANKWQGRNTTRWRNEEYDKLWKSADAEMDPVKRAAMFIKLNDLLVEHVVVIPIANRPVVSAHSSRLRAPMTGWDNDLWLLKDWYREA